MSYLFVVVIGALAGWVFGQSMKGSELGVMPDILAGAVGAAALVLFTRVIGIDHGTGMALPAIFALIGATATLYAMRYVMKEKPVAAIRRR